MAARRPEKPDWEALNRASLERARDRYQQTTPGERVEEMSELARELTKLSIRGRERARQ